MVEMSPRNVCLPVFESNTDNFVYNPYTTEAQQATSPKKNEKIQINTYLCTECDITFTSAMEFVRHNTKHTNNKVLTCGICTATFRRQDHLKRHMQSLHLDQKYCICPVCNKDYKRQDILLKHIKRKHTACTDVFNCRGCHFQCNSFTILEKHELSHVATERHLCSHCQAAFKRRDHMLRHVKSQHLNQTVLCPICNQQYKRKDHVVRHLREKHNCDASKFFKKNDS